MKKISFILLIISVLTLGGCSLNSSAQNNSAVTPVNTNSSQAPIVGSNAVNIQNFSFNPAELPVSKGTTVTWTNNDSAPHQIKSTTFNSERLSTGQTFSFTFNEAGAFDYSCAIHPSMTGKIIVK
jgi:plastocyanin